MYNESSSSFHNTDLDNFSHLTQGLRNSFYLGVKNNKKTTSDGKPPVEVIISAPTKLVTTNQGESPLTTGDGIVSDFKEEGKDEKQLMISYEELRIRNKGKRFGLKGLTTTPQTDLDRLVKKKKKKIKKQIDKGILILENKPDGKPVKFKDLEKPKKMDEEVNQLELQKLIEKLKSEGKLTEKDIERLIEGDIFNDEK